MIKATQMAGKWSNRIRPMVLAAALLAAFMTEEGRADRSVRCEGRIVSIGAFRQEVEQKCGVPEHVEQWEEGLNNAISQFYDDETDRYIAPHLVFGPIRMERWTYNFGSNRLIHYLYFKNSKLTRIETGDKGSD
jgi:hypothetical protein